MKEINAVTLDNVAYIAGQPGSIKPVNKGSASFDSFMDISTKTNTGNVQADVQPKQDAVQKVQVADQAASQKQPVKGMEDASSTQDNNNIVEDVALVQSVNDKITDVVKDALEIDDATLANAMAALGLAPLDLLDVANMQHIVEDVALVQSVNDKITDVVKDALEIDDATLANAMAALGLAPLDLLDVANMQQLVLFINGSSDVTDLLTDEFMMMDLNNLADAIGQIDWEGMTGMSKEDFMQVLEQSLSMTDNNTVQTRENPVKDNTAGTNQQMADNQTESAMQGSTQTETKEPVQGEALNGTNAFLQNLGKAVAEVQGNPSSQQSNQQQMVDIVNQVIEQVKVTLGKETTTMQMQLNPENLGKVLISVTSKNGVMTANFTVQTEEAKEALQSQMYSLREAIESRSLKVDAVEVEVSDFAFSQSSQADAQQEQKDYEKNDGRRFRFNFENPGPEEDGDTVSGSTSSNNTRRLDAGTSIDFTA